jgi:hypothetical protein
MRSNRLLLLLLTGCAFLAEPGAALAYSSGVADTWGFNSASGCNGCHGGGATPSEMSFTGPTSVGLGTTTKYTVRFTDSNGGGGGINVTAWSPTGGAALGTLSLCDSGADATCGNLTTVSCPSEITHTVRHDGSGGSVSFSFNYTAPNTAAGCAQDKLEIWVAAVNHDGSTAGDKGARFDHFIDLPCPTPTPTATATETPTPTVTPTPTGYVPPDKNSLTCQKAVEKALSKLGVCLRGCRVKEASAAMQGAPFDAVGCATGTPLKSCRAKFDLASQKLEAKAICPTCLDDAHRASLADRVTLDVHGETSDLYCLGMTPLP